MKPDHSENQATTDLAALAAVAHGHTTTPRWNTPPLPDLLSPDLDLEHQARADRVAKLKAQYEAGCLSIDENAIASKLVEALFSEPPMNDDSGS